MSTRLKYREVDQKFNPAIKAISENIQRTGVDLPPIFDGYKLNAGLTKDKYGREWQIQVHAVCRKKKMIKKDEIITLYNKNPWMVKVRVVAKRIIDWANSKA